MSDGVGAGNVVEPGSKDEKVAGLCWIAGVVLHQHGRIHDWLNRLWSETELELRRVETVVVARMGDIPDLAGAVDDGAAESVLFTAAGPGDPSLKSLQATTMVAASAGSARRKTMLVAE